MTLYDFLHQVFDSITPGITEGGLIVLAVLVVIAISLVVIGPWALKMIAANRADTKEIKAQVKNSHTTNLREEQDTRHDELARGIERLQGGMAALLKGVEGLQEDTRSNRERIDHVADRLQRHEDEAQGYIRRNELA